MQATDVVSRCAPFFPIHELLKCVSFSPSETPPTSNRRIALPFVGRAGRSARGWEVLPLPLSASRPAVRGRWGSLG